jgi:hypothetical protein
MRLRPSRPILAAAALVFTLSLLLYSGRWIAAMWPSSGQPTPLVELGFNSEHKLPEHVDLITSVYRNGRRASWNAPR